MAGKLSGKYIPIRPSLQIKLILCSFSVIIFLLIIFHKSFYSLEVWPIDKNYKNVSVQSTGSFDIHIHDVIEPDVSKENMIFEIIMTLKTPFQIDEKIFFDELIVHKGKILERKKLYDKKKDQLYEYAWNITIKQNQRFDFHLFPIDDHTVDIIFEIPKGIFNNIPFESKITYHDPLEFNGWNCVIIENNVVENNRYGTFKYVYALGLNKTGHRIALALLLPMFILFFIALFTLSLEPSDGLKTIISLILALNGFRVVLENISPKTSYLLFSDVIYLLFLCISFLILLIHLLDIEMNKRAVFLFVIGAHCVVISVFFYTLYPWFNLFFIHYLT
jgi:hypothetical protein